MDQGKDCSGYKTTLTWGVGVASRGKLRGLSLPIVNSTQKAAQQDESTRTQDTTKSSSTAASKSSGLNRSNKDNISYNYGLGLGPVGNATHLSPHFEASAPIPIPLVSQSWHTPTFNATNTLDESFQSFQSHKARRPLPSPLQRAYSYASIASSSFDDVAFSAPSTSSVGTFSDGGFPSPHELPATPEETSCTEPLINTNMDLFLSGQDPIGVPSQMGLDLASQGFGSSNDVQLTFTLDGLDNQCMNMYSGVSNASMLGSSLPQFANDFTIMSAQVSPCSTPAQLPTPAQTPMQAEFGSKAAPLWSSSIPNSLTPAFLSSLSPRTAYLVEYYANSICPVLVAVDGHQNPYRVHILALAAASGPTLVNAVAALAANVLHLRTKAAEQSYPMSPPTLQRGTSDEALQYRTASVNLFNSAVQDPAAAHDDSILATLVVLALFSISEGGLAQITPQMPEVRNLLALRGSNTSLFSMWATMFFTWLDVMSSTVKDKEAHLRTGTLDVLDFSANLGALEYLSFCEGRMYKVITRIKRSANVNSNWSPPASRRPSLINPFTGMPLSSPLSSPPPTETPSMEAMMNSAPTHISPPSSNDARQEFWSEWHHVRSRIRRMSHDQFSCPPTPSFSPRTKSEGEALLVTHASEVFRHAALLFAERAAAPHLSPSSPQIQQFVTSALHHLSSIPVASALNRVLLWPLMVVGTECVRPGDRDIVRLRCGDSMRDPGFFGVLSGLDVLERVWSVDDAAWDPQAGLGYENKGDNMPRLGALGGQAGRWRRAMSTIQMEFSIV